MVDNKYTRLSIGGVVFPLQNEISVVTKNPRWHAKNPHPRGHLEPEEIHLKLQASSVDE